MKRYPSIVRCSAALLVLITGTASANGVNYLCSTTADLRSGGAGDSIRISNQSENTVTVGYRLVDTYGQVQGNPIGIELAPKASVFRTIGQVFQEASLWTFNPSYFVQIGGDEQNFWPVVQTTYRNSANGQVIGLPFSCGELVSG